MRVAAVSFDVGGLASGFEERIAGTIALAASRGAELVVLPELTVLGAGWGGVEGVADRAGSYVELLAGLSRDYGLTVVGGSHLERVGNRIRNVCAIAAADGRIERVEKRVMTQWERNEWGLEAGSVPAPHGDIGILICYDSEFPELARPLCRGGIRVLCVPSYTETRHGFQRVRWSCLARAIENQVFVVHASLAGSLGAEPVPSTYGSSAILAPSVPPFPESAVLAETPLNEEGMAIADLDFALLEAARGAGDVRNWNDYLDGF